MYVTVTSTHIKGLIKECRKHRNWTEEPLWYSRVSQLWGLLQSVPDVNRLPCLVYWSAAPCKSMCRWCERMCSGRGILEYSGYCLKGTRKRNSSECGEYFGAGITSMAGMQRWSPACTATKDVVSQLACTDGCGNSTGYCLTCFLTSCRFVPGSSFDFHLQKTVSRLQWSFRWSRWWRHCRTVRTVQQG